MRDDLLPDPRIDEPAEGIRYRPGQLVVFSGTAFDHDGGEIPAEMLRWELILHHNEHVHFDGLPETLGTHGSMVVADHGDNTSLELCLSATDSAGRVGRVCRLLLPREVTFTIDSEPSGLSVSWDGVPRQTPFQVQTVVDGVRDLTAPMQQTLAETRYVFSAWSDAGPATHQLTVEEEPTRLVATYVDWSP